MLSRALKFVWSESPDVKLIGMQPKTSGRNICYIDKVNYYTFDVFLYLAFILHAITETFKVSLYV